MIADSGLLGSKALPDISDVIERLLICESCSRRYSGPCILHCHHTICLSCAKKKTSNQHIACPICGKTTALTEDKPAKDELVEYILDLYSTNLQCANCDRSEKSLIFQCNTCLCSTEKDCDHILDTINRQTGLIPGSRVPVSMYFCETCGQTLCGPCREVVHRSKMFSTHKITSKSTPTNFTLIECPIHGEAVATFCSKTKSLQCERCQSQMDAPEKVSPKKTDYSLQQEKAKFENVLMTASKTLTEIERRSISTVALEELVKERFMTSKQEMDEIYGTMISQMTQDHIKSSEELQGKLGEYLAEFGLQQKRYASFSHILRKQIILGSFFIHHASRNDFDCMVGYIIDRLLAISKDALQENSNHELVMGDIDKEDDFVKKFVSSLRFHANETLAKQDPEAPKEMEENKKLGSMTDYPILNSEVEDDFFNKYMSVMRSQVQDLANQMRKMKESLEIVHRDFSISLTITDLPAVSCLSISCQDMANDLNSVDRVLKSQKEKLRKMWQKEEDRINQQKMQFHQELNELAEIRTELIEVSNICKHLEHFMSPATNTIKRNPRASSVTKRPIQTERSLDYTDDGTKAGISEARKGECSQRTTEALVHSELQNRLKNVELKKSEGNHQPDIKDGEEFHHNLERTNSAPEIVSEISNVNYPFPKSPPNESSSLESDHHVEAKVKSSTTDTLPRTKKPSRQGRSHQTLHKCNSFEGHEKAINLLVEAVNEKRKQSTSFGIN
ncbi:hypothetical protein TCAL_06052 [Tigriopus californicus]|uniref:RING finger protein 207 n=1 Tax=Tigriopus californicus TaxID=6832 RepID=A0A553PNR9_TIGCA|nr:RING finger protein 207-like [Tigriopus californicus]TRY79310.1 hypothetical protein TCAL_06052 [Tigriopus californicus]|eukprot:TCALIF_06052-PA protein Name:"Similar to RNF207 RING finger protein 207 (Homo sapiens)" AED:0.00 eAED:0.00 QI:77/1/0.91/1/0.63/0.66/12/8/732